MLQLIGTNGEKEVFWYNKPFRSLEYIGDIYKVYDVQKQDVLWTFAYGDTFKTMEEAAEALRLSK